MAPTNPSDDLGNGYKRDADWTFGYILILTIPAAYLLVIGYAIVRTKFFPGHYATKAPRGDIELGELDDPLDSFCSMVRMMEADQKGDILGEDGAAKGRRSGMMLGVGRHRRGSSAPDMVRQQHHRKNEELHDKFVITNTDDEDSQGE